MVVMHWLITLGLIAGCGRIGFDPTDDGTGGGSNDGIGGGGVVVDSGGGGGGSGDAPATMPTGHYITGGSTTSVAPATSITTMTGPLTDTNMVIVVAIHWTNSTSSVSTVQDSFGNGFSMIGSLQRYNGASQVIWYKKVTAGTTIQVFFNQAAPSISVKWAAYRDIDQASTFVMPGFIGGSGTGTTAATSMLTIGTTAVVVASLGSRAADATAGPGFTQRHKSGGGVLEDLEASAGMVKATAILNSSNDWIIQMAALRPL